jgi:hypothetical protein
LIKFFTQSFNKEKIMTPKEHIAQMTTAIKQAVKVMGDRFGSTEQDVARSIQELKLSMQASSEPLETLPPLGSQSPQNKEVTAGT